MLPAAAPPRATGHGHEFQLKKIGVDWFYKICIQNTNYDETSSEPS
jgi:hypothetical protein